jgi:tRNA pseudouridine55 synthase
MNGVLILDKPSGCTSHDLVFRSRNVLRERHIGHLGTLDPLATGVLTLVVGDAARLAQYAPSDKTYEASCLLDRFTSTDDVTGETLPLESCASPSEDAIRAACMSFLDIREQVPPMVSAIKVDGTRLYELARKGETVERKARPVEIKTVEVVRVEWPRVVFRVACSGGTYVRSLCRTLGEKLGTGGCLETLRRIAAGPFDISEALTWAQFEAGVKEGKDILLPTLRLVEHLPRIDLSEKLAEDILHGRMPSAPAGTQDGITVLLTPLGRIAAMASVERGVIRPKKVFEKNGI